MPAHKGDSRTRKTYSLQLFISWDLPQGVKTELKGVLSEEDGLREEIRIVRYFYCYSLSLLSFLLLSSQAFLLKLTREEYNFFTFPAELALLPKSYHSSFRP